MPVVNKVSILFIPPSNSAAHRNNMLPFKNVLHAASAIYPYARGTSEMQFITTRAVRT